MSFACAQLEPLTLSQVLQGAPPGSPFLRSHEGDSASRSQVSPSPLLYLMASFFPWNYGELDLLVQHFPKNSVFKHLWKVSFIIPVLGGFTVWLIYSV